MKFKYRRYGLASDPSFRPVVTLRVFGPKGSVRWDALVDTGSDITLLPSALAEQIGINLAAAETSTIRGVGDQPVKVRESGVELELTDGDQSYRWDAEVSFLEIDDAGSHFALLGHQGCLDFFSATFDGDTRTMEILPTIEFPGTITALT